MRRAPLEVDLLRGLEDLATAPGRRVLLDEAPDDELVALLLDEARGYHAVELDALRRELDALEVSEPDRAGNPEPVPDPRVRRLRRAIEKHEAEKARLSEARARAALAAFERADSADEVEGGLEGEGVIVELFRDGYGLRRDLDARRDFLGLEAE